MDEITGKVIEGPAWTGQAVRRAVRTVKGSRPMVRWYGTEHLKHIAREISGASVLELTSDAAESIERTIPGAVVDGVSTQKNGEVLLISLRVNSEKISIGVKSGTT